MPPKKPSIVLNVEQFIHDIEDRPAIWNRNFHCNKAFLEQMWDELSAAHKLPKVVLKAKWKGLRDNFRVEYKRIPRADSGDFLVEPAVFESKWTHYYALLFLTEHMRHRMPKNSVTEDGQQPYLYAQQGDDCERTVVEPDLTNGLIRRLNDSDEEFDEDDVDDDDDDEDDGGDGGCDNDAHDGIIDGESEHRTDLISLMQQRQTTTITPPAAHTNNYNGEVYVLDDGGEVDLDLGNYERFLDITLHRDNNITTGKIYQSVIEKERTGEYLGKTVQVVPHITNAIQEWVERVAQTPVRGVSKPQVCIVELGGTIGDIEGMPFVEAFRQFQFRVKRENFCVAHVSLVPSPRSTGEPKTKPTQSSVRELRGFGLSPDLIVCRSEKPIGSEVKEKISNFCHVHPDQVICIHDLSSIYHVPLLMDQHGVIEFLNERLQLNIQSNKREKCLQKWKDLARRTEILHSEVAIAIVGKYTKLEDSYASVVKSLQHASCAVGRKLVLQFIDSSHLERETLDTEPARYHEAWQQLCNCDGVIVPGGFGSRGIEGKIIAANWCREKKKPYLGICLGLQAAVIGFARSVLGLNEANTTEIEPNTKEPLVIDMPEHHTGQMGGTMRLGKRTTVFTPEYSVIKQLYGNPDTVEERHRHRYEVNPQYVQQLEAHGMKFVGCDTEKQRMEIMELQSHPYFVATQYHPEYLSRPMKPSPPFLGLVLASVGRLQNYIARGCRFSPRQLSDASDDDDHQHHHNHRQITTLVNKDGDDGFFLTMGGGLKKSTATMNGEANSNHLQATTTNGHHATLNSVSSASSITSGSDSGDMSTEVLSTTKIYLNGAPHAET